MKHNNKINSEIIRINADIREKINLDFLTVAAVINEQKKTDKPTLDNAKIKNKELRISLFKITNEKIDKNITKHSIPAINPFMIPDIFEFISV